MSIVINGNKNLKFIKAVYYQPVIPPPKPYIDLGLPSGTLWSKCNLGAVSPEEQGDLYTWGFTPNGHASLFLNDIQGTEYDIARYLLGDEWCIPNVDQYQELIDNCQFNYDDNGANIIGPNGNMVYIPCLNSEWGSYYMSSNICEYARFIETYNYYFLLKKSQPASIVGEISMDCLVRPIYVGNE